MFYIQIRIIIEKDQIQKAKLQTFMQCNLRVLYMTYCITDQARYSFGRLKTRIQYLINFVYNCDLCRFFIFNYFIFQRFIPFIMCI